MRNVSIIVRSSILSSNNTFCESHISYVYAIQCICINNILNLFCQLELFFEIKLALITYTCTQIHSSEDKKRK